MQMKMGVAQEREGEREEELQEARQAVAELEAEMGVANEKEGERGEELREAQQAVQREEMLCRHLQDQVLSHTKCF